MLLVLLSVLEGEACSSSSSSCLEAVWPTEGSLLEGRGVHPYTTLEL